MPAEIDSRLATIFEAVECNRRRGNIKEQNLRYSALTIEPSFFQNGEDVNLFSALTGCKYPYGEWQELNNNAVMQLIYNYSCNFLKQYCGK